MVCTSFLIKFLVLRFSKILQKDTKKFDTETIRVQRFSISKIAYA